MPVNLSALSNVTTAAQGLANLVLVTPSSVNGYQPQNPANADGTPSTSPPKKALLFTYEGENSINLKSDITDHYVEDNTARQDQIALKPEQVTVHGFIGELNDQPPFALALVKSAADKLTNVSSFAPGLSTTALLAYNEAFFLYQVAANVANSAVAAWTGIANAVSGSGAQGVIDAGGLDPGSAQNDQQIMFQQLYGYWRDRTLFTVQTPWAVFQNMAIESLRVVQDPDTQLISDFELSFKMIRVASTQTTGLSSLSLQGRAVAQSSSTKDFGASSPPASDSLTSGLSGMGVA